MAIKKSLVTVGGKWILELDSDPSIGFGFTAPIGSEALVNSVGDGGQWFKFGSNDTDWRNVTDVYNDVTVSVHGLMLASDKTKIDSIATNATQNSSDSFLLSRTNHTGSQLSSTISNFLASVLSSVLTGIVFTTNTVVTATDSILIAFGKIQSQLNVIITLVLPSSIGIINSFGASPSMARADHVHNNVIQKFRLAMTTLFSSSSTSYVLITGFSITPNILGTFVVTYVLTVANTNNYNSIYASVFKNGIQISDSEMYVDSTSNRTMSLSGNTEVSVNGTTDFIDVRIKSTANTTNITNRILKLLRVNS
jgi:hypothetical protein